MEESTVLARFRFTAPNNAEQRKVSGERHADMKAVPVQESPMRCLSSSPQLAAHLCCLANDQEERWRIDSKAGMSRTNSTANGSSACADRRISSQCSILSSIHFRVHSASGALTCWLARTVATLSPCAPALCAHSRLSLRLITSRSARHSSLRCGATEVSFPQPGCCSPCHPVWHCSALL